MSPATRAVRTWSASGGPDPDLEAWLRDASDAELGAEGARRLAGRTPGRAALAGLEVDGTTDVLHTVVTGAGLVPVRELVELRRDLPLGAHRGDTATLAVRPFRPGADDAAVLDVNNRAFSWHPEQSGWTSDDLAARMTEPWFDADGFLVLDRPAGPVADADGGGPGLLGFCWTKVHRDEDPPAGEIFVIGVDPAAHGRGLGRGLVVAGLDHLASLGLRRALLWTEADNGPAMALYASLGFEVTRRHCWYVDPAADPPPPVPVRGEGPPPPRPGGRP